MLCSVVYCSVAYCSCSCSWNCYKTFTFCSLLTRCKIPCASHAKPHLNRQKWSVHLALCAFWIGNVLRATTACNFFRHLRVKKWFAHVVLLTFWLGKPQQRAFFFDISTFKGGLGPSVFDTFDLEMCFAPHRRALFRHLKFQKCSDVGVLCVTWKCASLRRLNMVSYLEMCFAPQRRTLFDIATSRTAPKLKCFAHFDLEMCFALQRRATFHFSSGQMAPHPAALARLLFDPLEAQIIGQTQWIATFLFFLAPASSSFSLFLLSDLLSSFSSPLWLFPPLLFHLSILSDVWFLNFLR